MYVEATPMNFTTKILNYLHEKIAWLEWLTQGTRAFKIASLLKC